MNSHSDPAFEIKQQLDGEVARRFDARRLRGLDAPEWHDTRGPLSRIPVPVQWLGIAAALIAAVTGLRSLYVDLTRSTAAPAPVESVSARPSKPEIAPPPVVERVDEPVAATTQRPAPRAREPLPPEPREQPTPTVAGSTAPADDVAVPPPAAPPEPVARATPAGAIDAAPKPAKVDRPEPAQSPPAFSASGGVVANMPRLDAGGVALAGFSVKGQSIPAIVREVPMIGATIVSLVGAPGFSSDDELPMNRLRSRTSGDRPSPPSSYYIRLFAGSRSGLPSTAEPVLVSKTLLAEPPGEPKELWGTPAQQALLKGAFRLGSLVDLAGLRTIAPTPNLDAQADLVAELVGRVFRVRVSAGPEGADGAARFEVRLAARGPEGVREIEGALTVERDRIVILALPEPHMALWGRGVGSQGATVFVVLSSRDEELDGPALAQQNVEPPILISGPEPRYPENARRHRVTGKVVVRALVRKDGSVDDPQIQEAPTGPGARSLINAALAAVLERSYLSARRDGEPVDAYVTVTIEFKDDGASIVGEPGE